MLESLVPIQSDALFLLVQVVVPILFAFPAICRFELLKSRHLSVGLGVRACRKAANRFVPLYAITVRKDSYTALTTA